MYIYHALINALSAHMIHINLNMILYTHIEHSPTKTIYIKYYKKKKKFVKTHYKHTHKRKRSLSSQNQANFGVIYRLCFILIQILSLG